MATVEELRALLREAEQAERKLGQEEYERIRREATFDWRLTAKPFGFRVECRYDAESQARVDAWREAFPKHGTIRDPAAWHGMDYVLGYTKDGEPFLFGGGGSIVLKLSNASSFNPARITREQAEAFESGIIPDELKKPW